MRRLITTLLTLLLVAGAGLGLAEGARAAGTIAPGALYFAEQQDGTATNPPGIGRVGLDGTGMNRRFITTVAQPQGVAADGTYVYWGMRNKGIGRARLDGTEVNESFMVNPDPSACYGNPCNFSNPYGVAVDGTHIYWTDNGAVGRAKLDGTEINPSFVTGVSYFRGLVVDDSYVYFPTSDKAIGRIAKDGSGLDREFITSTNGARFLAVSSSHIFWRWYSGGSGTGRAKIDGTGIENSFWTGGPAGDGIAVAGAKIYSGNYGWIARANVDGTNREDYWAAGSRAPVGLATSPSGAKLSLSPSSIKGNGTSTTTATFTAKDAAGSPVTGDNVTFTSSGSQTIGEVDERSPGVYRSIITSSKGAGTFTITATDTTQSPNVSASAALTQTVGPAAYVTVSLDPTPIKANGTSTSIATATVTDAEGAPVSGETVTITSSGDQQIGAVTAGSAPGTYKATVRSTTKVGSFTITATDTGAAGTPSGSATLRQSATDAANVAVDLLPKSIVADGTSTSTATATVTDAGGNPVDGDAVAFTATGAEVVGPVTAGSEPGTYEVTVRSTKTAGTATITARDTTPATPISGSGTLTTTAGAPHAIAVELSPGTIPADGASSSTATATVTDVNGNPVSGDTVRFASSGAHDVGTTSPGSAPGTYRATITSTRTPGTATITATDATADPDIQGSATLTQTRAQTTELTLTLAPATITADGSSTSIATVKATDAGGRPVSGDAVAITSSGAQEVGPVTAGSAEGTYEATIRSTKVAGAATITATDTTPSAGPISKTAELTQKAGPAAFVTVALAPTTLTADGATTAVATATVTDAHGNPVSGDTVAFTSSGAQRFGTVTAGSAPGTYRATVTSSTTAGPATITATDTSVGARPAGAATLTQTAGPTTAVRLSLSPAVITADGASTSIATATAVDAHGNPVAGDTVTITSSGDQAVSDVTPGDTPGTYRATITSTKAAGTATITARDTTADPVASDTATLTQVAGQATSFTLALSPDELVADGASTSTATVTVRDANGNPVTGDPVSITSSGAQQISGVKAGAAPGTYEATITSTTKAGAATITARDTARSPALTDDRTLTQTAGPAARVAVALSPASIVADGSSTTVATATVTDAHDNPVSDDTVTFAASSGQRIGAVSAGSSAGTYRATITSSTSAGQATITATDATPASPVSGSATLTQTAGEAATIALALAPGTIVADGSAKTTATVTVKDEHDNAVSGEDVRVTASGGQSVSAVTAGAAEGTYHAIITSTKVAGTSTISATDATPDPDLSTARTLTQTAGPAAFVAMRLSPASLVADGTSTSTATATVTDANGNAVTDGTVAFVSSGAQRVGPVTPGSAPGTYVATVTSTTTAGTATITATDTSASSRPEGQATLTQTAGRPTQIALALDPSSLVADGTSTSQATATVTDDYGNPVDGESVTISGPQGQQVSTTTPGGAPGTYVATVTASTTAGSVEITASDVTPFGLLTAKATLVQAVATASVVTVDLSPSSIAADGTSTTTATATVSDRYGNRISGETVAFKSSGGHHIGEVTAGTEPGTYVATITSTTKAGATTITATDTAVAARPSGTATLTQTPGNAAAVRLKLDPGTVTADGVATATATATVTDTHGNGVPGEAVVISSSGAQAIGTVRPGSAPGEYEATVKSTTAAGSATITATDTTPATALSDSASLRQVAGPATDIDIALSPSTLVANGKATSTATIHVRDAHDNPIDGDAISLSSTGTQTFGDVEPGETPGSYVATVTSSRTVGTDTITATDATPAKAVSASATLTQTRIQATNVSLTLSPATILGDGRSTSTAIVTVTDADGDAVSDERVTVESSMGQDVSAVRAGAEPGTYEATITSTKTDGEATITATAADSSPAVSTTATLTQARVQATRVVLELAPGTITADGKAQTKATATVTDADGNPVDGDDVRITSSGAQTVGPVSAGRLPGTYVATITATKKTGAATITATDVTPDVDVLDSRTLTQGAGAATRVVLTLSPTTVIADGTSTSTAVATVTDAHDNPVEGDDVVFASTHAQRIGTVTEGPTPGTYRATITSTTEPGAAGISATDRSPATWVQDVATLTQVVGPATNLRLTLTPRSVTADGKSTSTAAATVTDASGNPVSGDTVAFTTTGGQTVGAVTETAPGTYTATVTASTKPGTSTIRAYDTTVGGSVEDSQTLTQVVGPPAVISLVLSPSTIVADGTSTSTATATVTDAHGNPVVGEPVTIKTAGTQLVSPVAEGQTPGTYQATIRSTTVAGGTQVTAADGSLSDVRTLTQSAGIATRLRLSLEQEGTLLADGSSFLFANAEVADANGNPVSGDAVTFSSNGPQQISLAKSNGPGNYRAAIRTTSTPGRYTITARDATPSPALEDTATLTQTVGELQAVSVTVTPFSVVADGHSTAIATATATDAYNHKLPGIQVSFAAPGGQAVGPTKPGAESGTYQATITATKQVGEFFPITATASDPSANRSVTNSGYLTQTAIHATTLRLSLSPSTISANGAAVSTATVTATDADGLPVDGEDVRIKTSGAQTIGPVTAGSEPGTYRATITASTTVGTATITATDVSPSTPVSDTQTLTQISAPVGAAAVGRESLLWADAGTIALGKANLDGTGVNKSFVGSATGVTDVAADASYVYWTSRSGYPPGIYRARLNGSERTTLISGFDKVSAPSDLVVSDTGIYWTNQGTNTIGRANLDGTNVSRDFITGADQPSGIAVNATHVFWTNGGRTTANQSIGRADLAGTNVNQRFISGLAQRPDGIAVDATRIFWSTPTGIGRTNLDGSNRNESLVGGQSNLFNSGTDVTVSGGILRWAAGGKVIRRANTDGTGVSDAVTGLSDVTGLTVGPPAVTLSLSPTSIGADGTSTTTATFVAKNAAGDPVTGDTVRFTSSGGHAIGPVRETKPGVYTAEITATTTLGTSTITATDVTQSPVITTTATLTQVRAAVRAVDVTLSPASIAADGQSASVATASVLDANNAPVVGDVVEITASGGRRISAVTPGPTPGTYRATITASRTAGPVTITATDVSQAGRPRGTAVLEQTPVLAPGESGLVWTSDSGAIRRENADGSGNGRTLVPSIPKNPTMPIAGNGTSIFWSDPSTGTVGRVNADGRNANASFVTGAGQASGLAADDRYVYWTDPQRGAIGRAALDGSSVERSFITGAAIPLAVAVDAANVFWTTASGTIGRARIDGGAVTTDFIKGLKSPEGIAVDDAALVWGEADGAVSRSNVDGTGVKTLVAPRTGALTVTGVALDRTYVYWTARGAILRLRRDGAGSAETFAARDDSAYGVIIRGGTAVSLSPSTVVADGVSTTRATVSLTDASGTPVTGQAPQIEASDGVQVGAVTATATPGVHRATLTSTIFAGTGTVTATAPDAQRSTATAKLVRTPAEPGKLEVALAHDALPADGTSTTTATATLLDPNGNPVSGRTIVFSAPGGQRIGPVSAGRAPGTYRATVTTTSDTGPATISATAPDVPRQPSGSATLMQESRAARVTASIRPFDFVLADGKSKVSVEAVVTDADGKPVDGAGVTFTAATGAVTISQTYPPTVSSPGKYVAFLTSKDNRFGTETITARTSNGKTGETKLYLTSAHPEPPTVAIRGAAQNQSFERNERVPMTHSCEEGAGGPGLLVRCENEAGVPSGTTAFLDTSRPGTFTYRATAESRNGLTGTASLSYTVLDPPKVEVVWIPANVRTNRPAEMRFRCREADGGRGLAACAVLPPGTPLSSLRYTATGLSAERTAALDTDEEGPHKVTLVALSENGQSSTIEATYTVSGPPFDLTIKRDLPGGGESVEEKDFALDVWEVKTQGPRFAGNFSAPADPYSDKLTYRWTSSVPKVAAVTSTQYHFATLTPRRAGTTVLKVEVTDERGRTVTQSRTVTVADTSPPPEPEEGEEGPAPPGAEQSDEDCRRSVAVGTTWVWLHEPPASACFERVTKDYRGRDIAGELWTTDRAVLINGILFGGKNSLVSINVAQGTISFRSTVASVCKDPGVAAGERCRDRMQLHSGALQLENLLTPGRPVAELGLDTTINGLRARGAALYLLESSDALIRSRVALPVIKAGPAASSPEVTSNVDLRAGRFGLSKTASSFRASNAYIGPVKVNDVCFAYQGRGDLTAAGGCPFFKDLRGQPFLTCQQPLGTERFSGTLDVSIAGLGAAASLGVTDGSLAFLGLKGSFGSSAPIVPGVVFLRSAAAGLCLSPNFRLKGEAEVGALPTGVPGLGDLATLEGTFGYDAEYTRTDAEILASLTPDERKKLDDDKAALTADLKTGRCYSCAGRIAAERRFWDERRRVPWYAYTEGRLKILGLPLGSAYANVNGDGAVKFGAQARLEVKHAFVEGKVDGAIYTKKNPGFNIEGSIRGCVFEYACIGARGVFSSVGVAACAGVSGFEVGFGYTWSTGGISFMGGSCSLGNYRFLPSTRTAGPRAVAAAAGAQLVTVEPGQKALVLRANGLGAAPRVRLTGPDGTVLESPANGGGIGGFDQKTMLVEDPTQGATHLYVREPVAGTWRLEKIGIEPVAAVQTADVIVTPTIDAKVVTGEGRERAIEYAYVPRGDTEVTFVEEGGPDGVAEALGIATPGPCKTKQTDPNVRCGRLPFTPAQGLAGERKIVAQFTRNGLQAHKMDVAAYDAPRRMMPGRVRRVRIVRRRTGVSIVWAKAPNATRYDVAVKTSGGLGLLRTRPNNCRIVRVEGVMNPTKVKVQITPRDDEDRAGPAMAKGVLKGRKGSVGKYVRGDGRCDRS